MRRPSDRRLGQRPAHVAALAIWFVSVLTMAAALFTWSERGFPEHPASFASGPLGIAGIVIAGVVYASVGGWLVMRAPHNLLGWVVLAAGAGLAAVLILNQYIEASVHPFRPVPGEAVTLAWISGVFHLPSSAAAAVIALLLFPTGRLEWWPMRVAMALTVAGWALLAVGTAIYPDGLLWYPTLPSPLETPEALGPWAHWLSVSGMAMLVAAFGLTAVCLAWRYQHGSAEQQRPLAWVALGGTILAVTLGALFIGRYSGMVSDTDGERLTLVAGLGAVVLPMALIRYFRVSAVAGVYVPEVTFLFTDLAGSASMYQRFGDRPAFDIVRLHFDIIRSVTKTHHGVVVKTIGDAIMAVFSRPSDAVLTALDMFARIGQLNDERGVELVLKVGIGSGSAIRVGTGDHGDYFGQTVNAAARLQTAAAAGQICLGDEVLRAHGVAEALAGYEVVTETTDLRGVADDVTVHRIRVVTHTDGDADDEQPSETAGPRPAMPLGATR
jgi:class 3 adenylate cyclase